MMKIIDNYYANGTENGILEQCGLIGKDHSFLYSFLLFMFIIVPAYFFYPRYSVFSIHIK